MLDAGVRATVCVMHFMIVVLCAEKPSVTARPLQHVGNILSGSGSIEAPHRLKTAFLRHKVCRLSPANRLMGARTHRTTSTAETDGSNGQSSPLKCRTVKKHPPRFSS